MADTQSNIQVNIDTTQALASIKNLQRQISAFHSSMAKGGAAANAVSAQMQQTLINSVNATGKFSAQIRTIRTTTESFTDSLEKNKFSLGEYFRHAGGASKTFGRLFKTEFATINKVARENVKDLQTQYISLGRDASGAMKSIAVRPLALDMTDLATRTQVAAQKQAILNQLLKQGSTNLLNFGKNTQWAGRQLMVGFTLPLIAVGSAASKTFMDMETQAIRFKKVYGDLFTPNAESAQALKDIQELGKEFTKYGIAVSSTVGLAAEAAAAGFKGVDLTRQTTAATRLSILGQVESQKALETTIALQNAFSMSSENLAESIDFLNAVENQTVLSLDDVSTAIPKAAPIIQQLGGDVKDLAFFMTAMKEGGINASEGANAIKSGLASMINPTGKASAMLESFGINVKKIVVDNKGDLKKTVVEFATALNMLDPLNRAQAIEQMFGKFQFARLSTLFANVTKEGTQASRVLDLAGSSVQDLAALSEKELGMTSESAMNKFKGAVENLKLSLIPLGEQFLKAVTPIAEFITRILDKFNGLSDSTKKIIVVITSLVAGLGPVLLMTAGLVMNGLANMIKLFAFLKSAFNKTGQSTATLGTEVKYMTTEQRNAAAVAASLDQVHTKLAQTFTSEASAVNALTRAYQRAIAAQSQFVPVGPPITRGPIRKFAGGRPSTVGGTGNTDSELALLMPGETVIPTAMSKKYGNIINAMIADRIPGYDDGKPKTGSPSLYGGQSLKYSGLGVFAPGNTSSSALGMDRGFLMEGDSFLKSLTATAVGGGATLDDPVARLTRARTLEYHGAVKTFVPRIVDVLRSTVLEMEQNGENIDSIEDVTRRARPKLEKIFGQMTAQGGKAASSATALRQHLFFPGQAEMGGQFGETRVPGARRSSSGRIKDTMYRIKGSPFQSRVKTAYRNLFGANPEGSYAHMNESRMLGDDVPLRGGALALPASEQAPLAARVRAKARQIKTDFAGGGITKRRSGTEKAAIRQSGADDKREYVRGADSVDGKDPYIQTRDRKSPHRQAAKDGQDDARAYVTARDKALTQAGRKRRVAVRPQGPAPIGATPQPGATILPIVPGGPGTPPDPNTTDSKKPTRMQAAGSRINSMGGGMGLLGVNMGLSMLPDFAGKGMVQGTLAGANLGMMFGGYGMVAGAAIGTVTTAITALIAKEKEHAANVRSTFIPSTGIISLFGDKVLDTTTRIISLNGATDNLKSSLGIVSKEVQAVVNAIEGLPEEDPLFKFVEKISNQDFNLSSLTGEIRSKVATEISVGGLDPKNAQAYVQALLVAANRSRDFADVWQSVSKSVINAQEATAVGFEKMYQAVAKTGESFIRVTEDYYTDPITGLQVFVREEYSKTYDDLTDTQKIFSDSMLNMFNIVSNGSLTFDQINERISGLKDASFNSAEAVAALTAAINNTGKKDLIERLAAVKQLFKDTGTEAEMSVDKIIAMATALNTISDENLIKFAEKNNISILPGSGKYILEQYMKSEDYKKALTLQKKLRDALFNNDYVDTEDGVNGLSKASEAYLKVLDAEIKGLEEKRDAQKNVNDESQRHIDLQMKMKGLANEVVLAKISGDYIKAASLEQQAQNLQMEFDQDTEIRKKDAEIARLKDRAQDIRDGAQLSRSEISKTPKPAKVIKKASGGVIRGAGTGTSDSIPAYLSNGEYVIKADSVKKYGVGTFDALNSGKFANGGLMQRFKNGIPAFAGGGIVGKLLGGIGKAISKLFGGNKIVKPKPQTTIIPKLGSLSPAAMAKLTPEERAFHFASTDLAAMKTMLTSDVSSMSVPITGVSFNPDVAEAGLAYIKSGLGRIPGASSKEHTASIWELVQSQREALLTAKYPKADLSDVKTFNELYAKEFYGLGKDDLVKIFKGTRTTKPAAEGTIRDWRTSADPRTLETYFSTNPYIAAEYGSRIADVRTLGSEIPMFSMDLPVSQLRSRLGEGAVKPGNMQGSFEFPQLVDGPMLAAQTPKPYYLPTQVYGQMFPNELGKTKPKFGSLSAWPFNFANGGLIPGFAGGGIVGKLLGGIGKAISKLFVGKSMGKLIKPNEVETFLSDALGGATLPKIKKQELPAGVGGQYIPRFSDPASDYENLLPHILLNSKYKVQGNTAIHETMHHFDMDVMHDSFRRTIAKLRKDGKTDLADEYESLFVTAENKQKGMGLAVWEDRAITLQDYDSLTYFGGAAEAFADENTFKAYTKFMSSPKIKDKKLALKIGNPYGPGFSTDRLRGYFKTYSQFEHNALNMPMRLNPSFLRGLVENSPNMPQATKDVYLAWAEGLQRFKPPARSNPDEIRNSLQFQNFKKYITDNKLDKAKGFHEGGPVGHRHGRNLPPTSPVINPYWEQYDPRTKQPFKFPAPGETVHFMEDMLPPSMRPQKSLFGQFKRLFTPSIWGIGKDVRGKEVTGGVVDLPYNTGKFAYNNLLFPTALWADRLTKLAPGGRPIASTNRKQEDEWIKKAKEEGWASVLAPMAGQQALDIAGLLPWNRFGGAIGNAGISKATVARSAAEKAALKAYKAQNGVGPVALLQSIKSKFTSEYAKNLKLRSKFEAIKAEDKILTPEGEMARYELAISDALIASRKNNFTPLMHLKNATPEQLIAEHKALPSLIEEPFELNGKSYVFRFHKAVLNDGDTRNIEYFLNDIKTSNGIGMSDTATGFNLAEIIDPSTGMQAAYIRYDPITGHIRRRETDVPYRMKHLSAALYNKAAEITRIRHSSSLTQAGRASSPLIGGFMSHDNIFNIPGMFSPSGPSSLTTFLQKFIPRPKKPKKTKEQELTTSDSLPADYSGSVLTDEQYAAYQARNNPSGSSITPNTRVFANESPEATARREALHAETRARAVANFENNQDALLAAWRGNLYRTYNTYPFNPHNGAYDLADDYDLEMLMQLRDYRNAPAQVPWRDNSQRPAPVTFPGKPDWNTSLATGGFLDKGKLRVPKFANGGLIKGPGTGISDSIQAGFGYAGGGSIRVSNGEYVVKASSVRDYGVKTMDAINKGTATVGTEAGGTVYNINMPVTSNNANPEIVANEVMKKLKLEVSKNNKTNKVGP